MTKGTSARREPVVFCAAVAARVATAVPLRTAPSAASALLVKCLTLAGAVIERQSDLESTRLIEEIDVERLVVSCGLYFDFNSGSIKPASNGPSKITASVTNGHPEWVLGLEGHAENIGGDAWNRDLSMRRAAAVRTTLVEHGIAENRLTTATAVAASSRDSDATMGAVPAIRRRLDSAMRLPNQFTLQGQS